MRTLARMPANRFVVCSSESTGPRLCKQSRFTIIRDDNAAIHAAHLISKPVAEDVDITVDV